VELVTDGGRISDACLSGKGIIGVSIKEQDNGEILRHLSLGPPAA
jgi:hypothetical protein